MDDTFPILGRLAAGVAHDLTNYLSVIELSLGIVHRRIPDHRLRAEMDDARDALNSAIRLTSCLLDYARGGKHAVTSVDLPALVRRVLRMFGRWIPCQVAVEVEAEGARRVRGVQAELEQLVLNLLLNACDAMREGGELSLAVRQAGADGVSLEVSDSGCGMSEEVARSEGPKAPSSKRNSSGLGLGIVRAVAERHHASLHVGARPQGGTRVVVTFAADRNACNFIET